MPEMKRPILSEILLSAVLAFMGGLSLHCQDNPRSGPPRISVQAEAVSVYVTVCDQKGAIVRDLTQGDFTLSEDGRKQVIRFFARESDLPLTVGLLVDTTPSETDMLETLRNASRIFLTSLLRPSSDKAFLIQYSHEVELLQALTASPQKLEAALNLLEPHEFGGAGRAGAPPGGSSGKPAGGSRGGPPPGGGFPGGAGPYSTALADAVYLASEEILAKQSGRKALIILGDGDHLGNREQMAVEAAQKADAIIFTIRIFDKDFGRQGGGWRTILGGPGGGLPGGSSGGGPPGGSPGGGPSDPPPGGGPNPSTGKENLKKLAHSTGGGYFEVTENQSLEQIYRQIEEALRSQYRLGYVPEAGARDGYRKIKITVGRKGLVINAREGYYPK